MSQSHTLASVTLFLFLSPASHAAVAGQASSLSTSTVAIPSGVRAEHEAIHSALVDATKAPGATGEAARALAKVLHPHFVREEEIALPPLGLLARLASSAAIPDDERTAALAMSTALKRELPKMLQEHQQIRLAVETLRRAAAADGDTASQRLAEALALHAKTEEEVFYPAAVLVGDILTAGRGGR